MITLPEIGELSPGDSRPLTIDGRLFLVLRLGEVFIAATCSQESGQGALNLANVGPNNEQLQLPSGELIEVGKAVQVSVSNQQAGEYSLIWTASTNRNQTVEFRTRFYVQ